MLLKFLHLLRREMGNGLLALLKQKMLNMQKFLFGTFLLQTQSIKNSKVINTQQFNSNSPKIQNTFFQLVETEFGAYMKSPQKGLIFFKPKKTHIFVSFGLVPGCLTIQCLLQAPEKERKYGCFKRTNGLNIVKSQIQKQTQQQSAFSQLLYRANSVSLLD